MNQDAVTRERLTNRLAKWCRIPTHAAAPAGQEIMAATLSDALLALTSDVVRVPVGPSGAAVVHARSTSGTGSPVLLVGHYDTVPHTGPDEIPPVTIRNERLYGRGAADMKGGLVVMMEALAQLESRASRPSWEVLIVPDEEIGTPWSQDILLHAAEAAACALVLEPATVGGHLVRRRKGVGTVALEIGGRAAHAGRNPQEGRSAIAAMADSIIAIERLADHQLGTFVSVTTAAGGIAANVIPDTARLQIDIRVDSSDEAERVLDGIEAVTGEVAQRHEVTITRTGSLHRPPMPLHDDSHQLFERYRAAAERRGVTIDWVDVGGGSDANIVAQAGLPVLDGLGVCGADLHGPGEYAELASLSERADLLAELLVTLA